MNVVMKLRIFLLPLMISVEFITYLIALLAAVVGHLTDMIFEFVYALGQWVKNHFPQWSWYVEGWKSHKAHRITEEEK